MAALRRWRRAEFARIAWRDLAGWASLDRDPSRSVARGRRRAAPGRTSFAMRALVRALRPAALGATARRSSLIIVAMGKLGGGELNFSSDIDLVLLYPRGRRDRRRAHPISNQEFFTRLAQADDPAARAADRGRLRVPRRSAAAAIRRQRPGGHQRRGARGLPAAARPRLGALCLGQGARHHQCGRLP